MKIELFYFEGCPSWKDAEKNLKAALKGFSIPDPIHFIRVDNNEDVIRNRFIGSPTIRINGLDVDPAARDIREYSMSCRVYNIDGALSGWPSIEMIRKTLLESNIK